MSKNEVTEEVTPSDEQVTAEAGSAPEGEAGNQDSNERLAKLEAELQAFATRVEQETKARSDAEAKATAAERARLEAEKERDREVKIRIGHQRESGPKLQRLSELEKQIASQAALDEKLSRLEGLVEAMATNSLDSESIERINQKVAQTQQTRELERLRREVQQRSQPGPQQAPELTPALKNQLKDEYFPEFDVDPLELTDREWHQYDSRDGEHWKEQVRAEFKKRQDAAKQHKPVVPDADEIKKLVAAQVEEQVKAQREEDAKRFAEIKAELDAERKTGEEQKRVLEEQLKRAKGVDRGHETAPSTTVEKTLAKDLAKLNPALLYSKDPEEVQAYLKARDNDKALRDRILDNARRVQAQK